MSLTWSSLPNEIKLAVFDALDLTAANALARVDRSAYAISLSLLFRTVDIKCLNALLSFIRSVPSSYFRNIRRLRVATTTTTTTGSTSGHPATDALLALLSGCSNLYHLDLDLAHSLAHNIIPVFSKLPNLKHLSIANVGDELGSPISERLVVSIVASVPALEHLHLDRISRSHLHAPDLLDAYPPVPIVASGDESIPDHPLLGPALSLPSLLRLPSLRSLTLNETHLGDTLWSTTVPLCRLDSLVLGACTHASPSANSLSTQHILATVAPSLQSLTLSAALDDDNTTKPLDLAALDTLSLSPFFSPEALPATAAALASSAPRLSWISMHTFADDFVDACTALTDLLALRVDHHASPVFPALSTIDVALAPSLSSTTTTTTTTTTATLCTNKPDDTHDELAAAARALHDFCHDLSLTSVVLGAPLLESHVAPHPMLADPAPACRPRTTALVRAVGARAPVDH